MSDLDEEVELVVDGKAFGFWKEVSVRLSIEDLAGSFSVTFPDVGAETGDAFPIREGDSVEVRIAGEKVLTGYVDDFEITDDKQDGRRLSVSGRSKTADLVDCSALFQPVVGLSTLEIARRLAEPFGIDVLVTDERVAIDPLITKPLERWAVEPGSMVFDGLTQLLRGRGVLMTANADGDVELVRAGSQLVQQTVLRYGDNLKTRTFKAGVKDRYSQYRVRGQTPGTDKWMRRSASSLISTVDDDGVNRYRPLLIMADDANTFEELQARGKFERNTRAGKSSKYTCTVVGFTHTPQRSGGLAAVDTSLGLRPTGRVWRPNALVAVVDEPLGINTNLLLTAVTLTRTLEGGRVTQLELAPKEAYDVLDAPIKLLKLGKRRGKRNAVRL